MASFLSRTASARGIISATHRSQLPLTRTVQWACTIRDFSSSKEEQDEQKPTSSTSPRAFGSSTLRGVGQVVFVNNATSGMIMLGGLAIGDPYLAALAAVGTVSATAAAAASGLDKDSLQDGLFGYNGCLVGAAVSVFLSPLPDVLEYPTCMLAVTSGLTATVVGGAASPFVAAALKPAMGSVPQWTLAFNFVTLSMLLRSKPFAGMPPAGPPTPVMSLSSEQFWTMAINAPFKGVSQIFVVESSLTGAALLGGIALYSPGLAGHALLGSSIGALSGAALGVDAGEISIGLWGFNSALTSTAVGVFYCHSMQAVALSAGGAAATAVLFGALKTVFGGWDAPCLTLPFCITMSGCYLLKDAIPGLILAESPHSPEKNMSPPSPPSQ